MIHQLFQIFNWAGAEWVMLLLIVLSVVVLSIILKRYFELGRLKRQSDRFWKDIGNEWLRGKNLSHWKKQVGVAQNQCPSLETETLVAIHNATEENAGIADFAEAFIETRKLTLEKSIGVLGTIGANAAFIGLLGTVLGIIRAFNDISTKGFSAGAETVTGGIAEALVATAVGLFVAIPAVVFFNLLNRKIQIVTRKAYNLSSLIQSIEKK